VAIDEGYFLDKEKQGTDIPAGVAVVRDGGVVPKHKVPYGKAL
jgi:hypothetical protein